MMAACGHGTCRYWRGGILMLSMLIALAGLHRTGMAQPVAAAQTSDIRMRAEQGDAGAQNNLGVMYALGQGVPRDYREAVRWYRRAAEQGNANAQNSLGWSYSNGRGVPQDDREAVRWYRRAAEQGNANAQNSLGWSYSNGRGVPQDDREAVRWYRRAAEQGYTAAQFNLGLMYKNGRGVSQDDREAVRWFRRAAEQDYAYAQYQLGHMYARGEGVPEDDREAVHWFRRAAEQDYAYAQFSLGNMYDDGRRIDQSSRNTGRTMTRLASLALILAFGACAPTPTEDRTAADPPAQNSPEPEPRPGDTPSEPRSPWRTNSTTDPVTGTSQLVAATTSTRQTENHVGRPYSPILIVRCQDNKTDALITWNNYLDGNSGGHDDARHLITIRIGEGDPKQIRAGVSTDNEATFIPSPISTLLRPMVGESTLAARTTPYNESPQTAIFDITGADEALAPIAEACNWTLDREQAARKAEERRQVAAQAERARLEARMNDLRAEYVLSPFTVRNMFINRCTGGPFCSGEEGVWGRFYVNRKPVRVFFTANTGISQLRIDRQTTRSPLTCSDVEDTPDGVTLTGCQISSQP